jgi:hypothetical protein
MQKHELKITMEIRATPASVADAGKVRLGGESPSFGPVRAAPPITADNGKVRLGGESPSFGPIRVRVSRCITATGVTVPQPRFGCSGWRWGGPGRRAVSTLAFCASWKMED